MRLWPATSGSTRNSLANVRCAEARLFGRGAFYKLGTEHGVLKHNCTPEGEEIFIRGQEVSGTVRSLLTKTSPFRLQPTYGHLRPPYHLDLCSEGRS
ncbi:hypothetical protein TNCT_454131 [Trichonephila clavata]|uniref:Uncharacterized protein n=1 Tax=Trichonephila clavata TaxID=2740835 RepID=A0A8X6G0I4_TRICU|nr:hypothetical protein TNCT_454131 [Trichonephila clavata]